MLFDQEPAVPASLLKGSQDLSELWRDVTRFMVVMNEIVPTGMLGQNPHRLILRTTILGLSALAPYQERRLLRTLVTQTELGPELTLSEKAALSAKKDECANRLDAQAWALLRRTVDGFRQRYAGPIRQGIATAFDRLPQEVPVGPAPAPGSQQLVQMPTGLAPLIPFTSRLEKQFNRLEGGRVVISVPGQREQQLTFMEEEVPTLVKLQQGVTRYARANMLKTIVGSLYYHQVMVRDHGWSYSDALTVNFNKVLDLMNVRRAANGSHTANHRKLMAFTYSFMARARAEWIPDWLADQGGPSKDRVRWTPLYIVEGGEDALDPDTMAYVPEEITYRIGTYFLAALTGGVKGAVASLDISRFFEWRMDSVELPLHLYLTQMLALAEMQGQDIYKTDFRRLMAGSGIPDGSDNRHSPRQAEKVHNALRTLRDSTIIGDFRLNQSPSPDILDTGIEVYPLSRRLPANEDTTLLLGSPGASSSQ